MLHPSWFALFACVAFQSVAAAQLQPGDRVLVGYTGSPSAPRILITDSSFASRRLTVTGLPNRWIDGVAFEAARGQLFVLSRDVYAVQVSGDQAAATFYGSANSYERTIFIGHNGEPVVVRDVPINRHALFEISSTATRPLFPNQIGDRICGATYDPVSRSYFLHTTPVQWPASPQLWKVDHAGNAEVLVQNFIYCANHSDLVPDGRGGVYVASGNQAARILHVNAAGVVQPLMFPVVNQHAAPAGIQRDRIYVYDENTETYLLDLATLRTVPQWGSLSAFSEGEMTGLIEIPAPCAGSAVSYGAGCADRSSAILQLEATGCAASGAAIGLHLDMGYPAPSVLFAGISRTSWLGVPLPFELATLGGGACRILTSNELILGPFENTAMRATIPIPFERDPTLIGASFFVQGGMLDAAANTLGIATSNGVAITIG